LLRDSRPSDVPLLLAVCDLWIESNNPGDALDIWNGLAAGRRIPFSRLEPARAAMLTNGDFRVSPTSHGFDWRLAAVEGVSASIDEGGGLRLSFSGKQPENCAPVTQFVPVQ